MRRAGMLAAALGAAAQLPLPRARGKFASYMPDALSRLAIPRPPAAAANGPASAAAVTAYQLQTPRQAVLIDLIEGDYASRFNQLVAQGYRPIWLQGAGNGPESASFSAIFVRDGSPAAWYEWHNLDDEDYQAKFDYYAGQGYIPISVTGYRDSGGETRYGAIWRSAPGVGYYGAHGFSGEDYQDFFDAMDALGMRPQLVEGYPTSEGARYMSIWSEAGSGGWVAGHGMSAGEYQGFFEYYTSDGFHPISVSGYDTGGAPQFAAIMVDSAVPGFEACHESAPGDFYNTAADNARGDGQPIVIDSYDSGGQRRFAGVWVQRSRAWSVTGRAGAGLAGFDSALRGFMQARGIPAGALAVTKDSRLVLARGYRWQADAIDPVEPTSLFRIASLSKAVTSMAVMRLVEDGLLSLDAKLTGLLTLTPRPGDTLDPRVDNITVRMLLEHSGGWDIEGSSFDPMFEDQHISSLLGVPLPVSQQNIITMMNGRALDFDPGTQFAYSNYGYLLLGRIIEAVSGQPYAAYVQEQVLDRLFIKRMRLGRTEFEQRQPGEVPYYSYDVGLRFNVRRAGAPLNATAPYGAWNIENMDSHGGWLASAVDLARFCTALDRTGREPVLNASSIARTFAVPLTGAFPDGAWYACGWLVREAGGGLNTWHDGSLDGTFTFMVRRYDGVNCVALFDQRDDPSGLDYSDIDGLLYDTADSIAAWPGGDLFPLYGLPTPGRYYTRLPYVTRR